MYKIIAVSFVPLPGHGLNPFLHMKATKKNRVTVLEQTDQYFVVSVTISDLFSEKHKHHGALIRRVVVTP